VESPILIDVWTVDETRQDELVGILGETMRTLVAPRPGFVSAQIYESVNGGMVLLDLRMRTAADRRQLTDDPELQQAYREARTVAASHTHFYRLVQSFGEPAPSPEAS
jgi:hypothetical protein